MDQDIKNLLEENLRISKENNILLLKIRSVQRWSQITKIFYWVLIIGISFGAFYFIKPYMNNLLNMYSGGISDLNTIKKIGNGLNLDKIQNLLQ